MKFYLRLGGVSNIPFVFGFRNGVLEVFSSVLLLDFSSSYLGFL